MKTTSAKAKSKNARTAPPAAKIETIVLGSELNVYGATGLKDELLEAVARSAAIELDLSQVVEIDSAAFQVVMLAHRECCRQGKALRFTACSAAVLELIQLYNLADHFGVHDAATQA